MELNKENWKKDHLNFKHKGTFYDWCPLCMAKKYGKSIKNSDLGVNIGESVILGDTMGKFKN